MNSLLQVAHSTETPTHSVVRGVVVEVAADSVLVTSAALSTPRECAVLQTGDKLLRLIEGDPVLVWLPPGDSDHGVIVGKIASPAAVAEASGQIPDELVIEARSGLTIKCGDGSITFRADGRILVKGKELVSHAQGRNRIRGGSVAIN